MNTSQLSAVKRALFALLALLLIVLSSAVYVKVTEKPKDQPFACGTWSPSYPLNEKQTKGKDLFIANCASCHNKNMKDALTGPPLGEGVKAWEKYPRKDLYRFIRNSQGMIKEKHPRALEIWKQYKPTYMNSFPALTDEDMEALIAYIQRPEVSR